MAQALDLVNRIALAPRHTGHDCEIARAHHLVGRLNNGQCSTAISPGVTHSLFNNASEPQWWYLSYQAGSPRAVVLAAERHECAALHAMPLLYAGDASNNDIPKYSYMDVQVLKELCDALPRGNGTDLWMALHLAEIELLTAEQLQTYFNAKTGLGVMTAKKDDASPQQRHMRGVYTVLHRRMKGEGNRLDVKGIGGLSDAATTDLRTNINMLARALARGYVQLSSCNKFRDSNTASGFIDKATLLQRLELPRRYVLIDIPQCELNSTAA
jgi:hypothetical protein